MKHNVSVVFGNGVERRFRKSKPALLWFVTCSGFCHELASYIASHEEAGIHFDTECQSINYDNRITVLLSKLHGAWTIIEIIVHSPACGYRPVFVWKRMKCGAWEFIAKYLAGWCVLQSVTAESSI